MCQVHYLIILSNSIYYKRKAEDICLKEQNALFIATFSGEYRKADGHWWVAVARKWTYLVMKLIEWRVATNVAILLLICARILLHMDALVETEGTCQRKILSADLAEC